MNTTTAFSLRVSVTVIIADPGLGTYLVETLLSSFCEVCLMVSDENLWSQRLNHLKENKNLTIKNKSLIDSETLNYLIISEDFFTEEKDLYFLKKVNERISSQTSILLILPYATNSSRDKGITLKVFENFSIFQNLKTIFLGDIFGPRMVLGGNSFSEKLRQILIEGLVEVGREQYYFPTFAPLAAKQIVKSLFSFGVREGVFYYSHQIKESEIPSYFKKYVPSLVVKTVESDFLREFFNVKKRFLIETSLLQAYTETFRWFTVHPPEIVKMNKPKKKIKIEIKPIKLPTPQLTFVNKKIFASIFLVLILPFLILGISILSLFWGVKILMATETKNANYFFNFAQKANNLSSGMFLFYTKIPIAGKAFESSYNLTRFMDKSFEIAKEGAYLYETTSMVFDNVLAKKDFELERTGNELSRVSGDLYTHLGFIKNESQGLGIYSKSVGSLFFKMDIENIRQKLLAGEGTFKLLPEILGKDGKRTYMILFQNNMEIRPTGGFIGSFALVTFEKGKFNGFEVYDVYDADGQLKGYVAPPAAIRDYLGEAAWHMRDANWDPDFPSSASKIEWFLGKELGKSVDGVIGIDLSVAHTLVSGVGKINLPDFGKEINSNNFYTETQAASEENFFPGSDKKRNFLTALSRSLLLEITEKGIANKKDLAINLLKDLDERHIQIALNDPKINTVFSNFGFDGGLSLPVCTTENCQNDYLAVVDANVGVNKANYFISKSINLEVYENQEFVEKRLLLTYKNTAQVNTGNLYKNYLRIIIPPESTVMSVVGKEGEIPFITENISGKKEVGVLVEIPEGVQKSIQIIWNQKNNIKSGQEGEYQFFLRKQAGTSSDPVFVRFNLVGVINFESGSPALTQEGTYSYNTTLTRDILTRIKINK